MREINKMKQIWLMILKLKKLQIHKTKKIIKITIKEKNKIIKMKIVQKKSKEERILNLDNQNVVEKEEFELYNPK